MLARNILEPMESNEVDVLKLQMASADVEESRCVCVMTAESDESIAKGSIS